MTRTSMFPLRFGPYPTPVVVTGTIVECEVRGLVTVIGTSSGPIHWPVGRQEGIDELIVFKALARAVRHEEAEVVAAAWGVSLETAQRWHSACHRPIVRRKQTRSSPPIPWKDTDDAIIRSTTLAEAARLTGRTITAVRKRRRLLGLPDGRLAAAKPLAPTVLQIHAAEASHLLRQRMAMLAHSLSVLHDTMIRAKATVAFWDARSKSGGGWGTAWRRLEPRTTITA